MSKVVCCVYEGNFFAALLGTINQNHKAIMDLHETYGDDGNNWNELTVSDILSDMEMYEGLSNNEDWNQFPTVCGVIELIVITALELKETYPDMDIDDIESILVRETKLS